MNADRTADIENSISNLVVFLSNHYHKKVFILIDEYDSQLTLAIDSPLFSKIANSYGAMLSHLKDNELVEKIIITGILPIALGKLFSGLNNDSLFTVNDVQLSNRLGFTSEEVDSLLNKIPDNDDRVNKLQKEEIALWYNGYTFGNTIIQSVIYY